MTIAFEHKHDGDAVSGWMYKTVTCGALWLSGLYPDSPCPMTAEQGADTVLYAATDRTLVQRQDLGTTYKSLKTN